MAKKKRKVLKKQKAFRVSKKRKVLKKQKAFRVSKKKSQELVIKVQSVLPSVITEKDIIEPIHDGKKLAITKTWVSDKQIMRMVQKTPPQHIYTRPGKGGQRWSYVTGNYVEKVLNYVFGFLWDFEVVGHGQEGDFIWVQGKLTVKNTNGDTITKTQFGRKEVAYLKDKVHKPENMLDYGNDLKSATTDALKKCASMLGIASDIYGKLEYKQETGIEVKAEVKVVSKDAVAGPDGDKVIVCQNCDGIMSQAESDFSQRLFKKNLCRDCQKEFKGRK